MPMCDRSTSWIVNDFSKRWKLGRSVTGKIWFRYFKSVRVRAKWGQIYSRNAGLDKFIQVATCHSRKWLYSCSREGKRSFCALCNRRCVGFTATQLSSFPRSVGHPLTRTRKRQNLPFFSFVQQPFPDPRLPNLGVPKETQLLNIITRRTLRPTSHHHTTTS